MTNWMLSSFRNFWTTKSWKVQTSKLWNQPSCANIKPLTLILMWLFSSGNLTTGGFSTDACRSMVALMDASFTSAFLMGQHHPENTRPPHWLFPPHITFQNSPFFGPSLKSSDHFAKIARCNFREISLFWHLWHKELCQTFGRTTWQVKNGGAPPIWVELREAVFFCNSAEHCNTGMWDCGMYFSLGVRQTKKRKKEKRRLCFV